MPDAGLYRRYSLVYYALNALTLNIVKIGLFRVVGINVASTPWFSQLLAGLAATALALVLLTSRTFSYNAGCGGP